MELAVHALITGVGGFIGGATAQAFLEAGWRVTGVCRKRRPSRWVNHANLQIVATDLRDCEGLPARYDYLVHCAADVPAYCADENEMYRSNVDGMHRLLDHAGGAGAKRLAFMSSMAVYGAISTAVVNEETPLSEADAYGRSKIEGERLLSDWVRQTGGRGVSIRLPGIVGAGAANNFLSDTLQHIMADRPVNGHNPDALFNNVIHVKDLAAFIISLDEFMPPGHTVLTIAARESMTIRDVLARLYALSGKREQIRWSFAGGRPFLINADRACSLGFQPATVIDSLNRFVTDVLSQSHEA